ncbi:phage tail sheath family protein [Jeotgalibacillus terrae]|uniref:Phage tail sheath family protein n=1 Tax=Jeotgalibacillus terrae TaxID=587735 RepID=A0ABW5ZEM9_9BACL|nr:phage tail sheath family protein [Jeotgalibacillus terrae]MBM7580009.1 phage tail sheath protein FI [Jeotgalibacillus terrae]
MMYKHGIDIVEQRTGPEPIRSLSAVQVVFGTAQVNLLDDPAAAVNKPIVINSEADAKTKLGYSRDNRDFDFTVNHSLFASLELYNVAPIVVINVLDPAVHKTDVTDEVVSISKGTAKIANKKVLLSSVVAENADGLTTYERDVDYTLSFNTAGEPVIGVISGGQLDGQTEVTVSYSALDPSAVTEVDVIGGYDAATGVRTGIELMTSVYPQYNILGAQLLAPGFSHKPDVAAVLAAKSQKINGNFSAMNVLDVDTTAVTKYEDVAAWKVDNGYDNKESIVAWPMVKKNGQVLYFSAVLAARIAQTDAENDDVPNVSPSNKPFNIDATVLKSGTEMYLDQPEANVLNGAGIVTAINFNGWRTWGNNTAAFPESTLPQDRFIAVRRVFQWWGNTFILAYFNKVDNPADTKLIESVVSAENIRANGFAAEGKISGAVIEFRESMNPIENILNGKIVFIQRIGAYSPAEQITNILEFDPTITATALGGA